MSSSYISGLLATTGLTPAALLEVSELSTTVKITANTISAQASDNSYNDSANGLVAAGFAVNDRVQVTGFTGDVANNIFAGTITALTAGKMTIGGTDGDVIVDDAAGESVTITKWVTRRTTAQDIANLASGGGGSWKEPVRAATTAPLPANTYANGTSGVGATLTGNANGALSAQDGVTLVADERLLVKDETSAAHNGVYVVTQVGDASNPYILTRATDADQGSEFPGAAVKVTEGTTNADTEFVCTTDATVTMGTTGLSFSQRGGSSITAKDEGSALTSAMTSVDFVGAGVSATNSGGAVTVTIPGASSTLPPTGVFSISNKAGSRALNTVYQNTTGHPIILVVNDSTNTPAVLYVGAVSADVTAGAANTYAYSNQTFGTGGGNAHYAVVPPNYYYKMTGGSLNGWLEVEFNTGTCTDSGNISGSRALNTAYQNTSGGMRIVEVSVSGVSNGATISGFSDSAAAPALEVVKNSTSFSVMSVLIIVPNNYYYKVTASAGAIQSWHEYDFNLQATQLAPSNRSVDRSLVMPWVLNNTDKSSIDFVKVTAPTTGTFFLTSGVSPTHGYGPAGAYSTGRVQTAIGFTAPLQILSAWQDNSTGPTLNAWYQYLIN
jgi:hypothetical protein